MSGHQSEATLEQEFISQLVSLGYEQVKIKNEKELLANLKKQLEKHNNVVLNDNEFSKVLNHLNKGSIFDRAKILRDRMQLTLDNGDSVYLEFLQSGHWCQNLYQVTNQITMKDVYKNRYDVTILINGLPLVQIELKRRGMELKEAFNQVNRYRKHSYNAGHGLFQYIQMFVISSGVNTKYFANNAKQTYKQTFFWADEDNRAINDLKDFTEKFFEPCHLSKMICKYTVLNVAKKILMVLRPYQYYAVEAITDRVIVNHNNNGYIWHTTGSGKTLTSFKASQIIMDNPKVHKVLFVVDRKDLDYQTAKEFNSFSAGSVDSTDNTKKLVEQLCNDTKLIVTTIQKLNNAIQKRYFNKKIQELQDKKVVIIFDECHRSQFGETHARIEKFFGNSQMFGFTGTPIFEQNAMKNELGKRTTKDLFDECLHKYVITDAIRDENVLPFSVEYIGKYEQTEESKKKKSALNIEVEKIDTSELMMSDKRLRLIAKYITDIHNSKTRGRKYTGMFCVSSINMLIKYYDLFKEMKEKEQHKLKIATIFSYTVNEDDRNANGLYDDVPTINSNTKANPHTREILDGYIDDYNKMFDTKYSTRDSQLFYNYYNDIAKKVKNREIDILLVVSMFLTGFDSPSLNTLYVDKNLKHHGLIQAFSRTNRVVGEDKPHGNIVCFRNLKDNTDEAVALFSDKDAKEDIFVPEYKDKLKEIELAYQVLNNIAPSVESVDDLDSETEKLSFIRAFRDLIRLKSDLSTYVEYDSEDMPIPEQEYEDYKSKYLDIYESITKVEPGKESILEDVDFMLELIHRDEINVDYILKLLAKLKLAKEDDKEKQKKIIMDLLGSEVKLRTKKELIEKFIDENLPNIDVDDIDDEFERFWSVEEEKAFDKICKDEKIQRDEFRIIIDRSLFSNREPLRNEIINALETQPKLLERKSIYKRVLEKFNNFMDTFINDMGG